MKKLSAWLLLVALFIGCLSFASVASADDAINAWVKTSGKKLKMYDEMSTYANVMVKIPNGKKVKLYDYFYGSDWAEISWNGYYGYVKVKFLSFSKPVKPTPKPTHKPTPRPTAKPTAKPVSYEDFKPVNYYVKVTLKSATSNVNMRWQPSSDSDVIGVYPSGAVLEALEESKTWIQVIDPDTNRVGFIMGKYLTETSEPVFGEDIEETEPELIVSPVNEMDGLESLQAAIPDVHLVAAPDGAQDVSYCWIMGEPVIGQMEFKLDGVDYTLRAAFCEVETEEADIDGIFLPLHEESENDGIHIMVDDSAEYAVAHFFSAANLTQYSLVGAAGADNGETVKALAQKIFPAE